MFVVNHIFYNVVKYLQVIINILGFALFINYLIFALLLMVSGDAHYHVY